MKKNKNQKFTKLLLAIFLCTFFISSSRVYALPSLDEQIREIEQKINENKAAAQQKQSEANDLKSQISLMDKDISATQNNIDSLNKDIANSQKEIDRLVTEIKINEERIIKNKEDLKRLVQLLYEKGSLTSVEILASTRSITDFLNQEEYNRAIEEKINNTVTEVKALKNQLAIQKKDQENKKKQLENKKAELVAREHELSLQKSNKDNLLKQTQGEQAKYQKLVKELETQKKAVESSRILL